MKLLCAVDQAECFRRGIDAPYSTIKIEVNPENLSQEQRAFVADNLKKGHDLTCFPIVPPTYEGFLTAINKASKQLE